MKTWIFVVFVCMILIFINELINITKSYLLIHYYKDVADINLNKNCNDIYCEAETGRFKLSNNVYDIILPTDINNMKMYYYVLVFIMVFLFIGYYAKLIKTYEKIDILFKKYEISSLFLVFSSYWLFAVTYFLLLITIIICITILLVRRYAPIDKKGYLQLFKLNYDQFIKKYNIKNADINPDDIGIGNVNTIFIGSIIPLIVIFVAINLIKLAPLSTIVSVTESESYKKDNNLYKYYISNYLFIFVFLIFIFLLIFICSIYLLADKNYNNPSKNIAVNFDGTIKPFYDAQKEDFIINTTSVSDETDYDKYSFNAGSTYNSIDTFYDKYYYNDTKYNFLGADINLDIPTILAIAFVMIMLFLISTTIYIKAFQRNDDSLGPVKMFGPVCFVILVFILYIYLFTNFNKDYNKNYIYGVYNSIYNNYLLRLNNIVVPYIHLHESQDSSKENTDYLENYIITNVFASIITNNLPIYNESHTAPAESATDIASERNQSSTIDNLIGYTIYSISDENDINIDDLYNLDDFTTYYDELFGTDQINLNEIFKTGNQDIAKLKLEKKLEFLTKTTLADIAHAKAELSSSDNSNADKITIIENYIKYNKVYNKAATTTDILDLNMKYLVTIIKYFKKNMIVSGSDKYSLKNCSVLHNNIYLKDQKEIHKFIIKSTNIINHNKADLKTYNYKSTEDEKLKKIVENFLINLEYMKYNFNEYLYILNTATTSDETIYKALTNTENARKQFRQVLLNLFTRRIVSGFSLYQNTEYKELEQNITDTYKYLKEDNYDESHVFKDDIVIGVKYTTLKYLHGDILSIKNQSGNEIANSQLSEIIKANYKNIYNDNAKLDIVSTKYDEWGEANKYDCNFNDNNKIDNAKINKIANDAKDTINNKLIYIYVGNIILLASVFATGLLFEN